MIRMDPGKRTALIVVNSAQSPQTFHIRYRGKLITTVLSARAVGTCLW